MAAPEPFATTTDLAAQWRALSSAELATAQVQLARASAIIRRRVPAIDVRIARGQLDPVLVVGVVCDMVKRAMRNPDGYRSESDGDYNYNLDPVQASGVLEVLPDELSLLAATFTGTIHSRPALAPHHGRGPFRHTGRF